MSKTILDQDLIDMYMRSISHRTENTLLTYRGLLNKFTRYCESQGISLLDVTRSDISDFLSIANYKHKTQVNYKIVLSNLYEFAIEEELIDKNPTKRLTVGGEGIQSRDLMLDSDFKQLVANCKSLREKAILYTFYYTGMRAVELRYVEIKDVDFDRNRINVRKSKTKQGLRQIPINPDLKPILRAYVEVRKGYPVENDWLFVTKHGSQFSGRTIIYFVKQIRKGVSTEFTCHDFRRSFITRLYRATHNIVLCQKYAGHTTIETTRSYIIDDTEESDKLVSNLSF